MLVVTLVKIYLVTSTPGILELMFLLRHLRFYLMLDFGDNFIRAIDVKTKRTVGKDHLLKDGDVVEIISGK